MLILGYETSRIYMKHSMPSKFVKDLTGLRFGRLIVIEFAYSKNHKSFWNCLCDCGKQVVIKGKYLSNGDTKSCGCLARETAAKNSKDMYKKSSAAQRRPGLYENGIKHPLVGVLKGMKGRCYNKNCPVYRWYGRKGVGICSAWIDSPEAFVNWGKENGYKKGLQIDRVDSDGWYCPENCRFISRKENIERSKKARKHNEKKKGENCEKLICYT